MTETTTGKPGISVAITVQDGKVLMVRRRIGEGELMWQFPAGGIEEGEGAAEAAVRETFEVTGLAVQAIRLLGERLHPKTGLPLSYTACEVVKGDARVADDEVDAIEWVTHGALAEYVPSGLFGPVQEYLDEVLSR
ncbi:NUDIX hydrolase [Streptomyces colonosanans]|uniref:NUDIX hydrolase n=1 Tax=Streptomyces colonosanans TaxID=1428652 RepID=A0A1S2PRH1_9ACTN|nr:NUDIX domain-containing protein [Streptomyces colonosanans]OIJ95995.1 NUDIX hydrolase [Streptomyces colonosanans]